MRASSVGFLSALVLGVGLVALPGTSRADTFFLTSCHLSDGCGTATEFGTVTLNQVGTTVTFDVVLNSGNLFVETGAGGGFLFLLNDSISGSTITNMSVTFNGATVTEPGGLTGLTNQPPIMADGTGTFTAGVECTVAADCNGGSGAAINDLHFTVTGATLAALETKNANGNFFVADIFCGQTGCTSKTGPIDVSNPAGVVPLPPAAMLFGSALVGLGLLGRRRKGGTDALAQA